MTGRGRVIWSGQREMIQLLYRIAVGWFIFLVCETAEGR